MAAPAPQSLRHSGLKFARRTRFVLLALILAAVCAFIYLNEIGLPGFIKQPLLSNLRQHGLDVQFSRLRWRWYRGLVVENVRLEKTASRGGPQFHIAEAAVRLNESALWRGQLLVDALAIHNGRFSWLLPATNQLPQQRFEVTDIRTDLAFSTSNEWRLIDFQALCLGAQLRLSGVLTHASSRQSWPLHSTNPPPTDIQLWLRDLINTAQQIQCQSPPTLLVNFSGNARDPAQWKADARLVVKQAVTPWGAADNLRLALRFDPPTTNQTHPLTRFNLSCGLMTNSWGRFSHAVLSGGLSHPGTSSVPERADWTLHLPEAHTRWGYFTNGHGTLSWSITDSNRAVTSSLILEASQCRAATWTAQQVKAQLQLQSPWPALTHGTTSAPASLLTWTLGPWSAPSDYSPTSLRAEISSRQFQSPWATAQTMRLSTYAVPAARPPPPETAGNHVFWQTLNPFALEWQCDLDEIATQRLQLQHLSGRGRWAAPLLVLEKLEGQLYNGRLEAQAQLNTRSRELRGEGHLDLDWHPFTRALTTNLPGWFHDLTWQQPPVLKSHFALLLPPWSAPVTNWPQLTLPTLSADGFLQTDSCSFRQLNLDTLALHFNYTNRMLLVPNLEVHCPQGSVELAGFIETSSGEYQASGKVNLDPLVAGPFLNSQANQILHKTVQFTVPPAINGRWIGNWHSPEPRGFSGQFDTTNLTVRGEFFSQVSADLLYTNRLFTFKRLHVLRQEQRIDADQVTFDLDRTLLAITNVKARFDALIITRIIGPKTTAALAPYKFSRLPQIQGHGWINVANDKQADLVFKIDGEDFQYQMFHLPRASGTVNYRGRYTTITNFQGSFYQGNITGNLVADDAPAKGTDVSFHINITNANAQLLLKDLGTSTNTLEGTLSGDLTLTRLNSADWNSWQGFGRVRLDEGLIWDIPIFGVFSPVFNALVPGLGTSRADHGSASFIVTNSVITTKNMEIQAPLLRLYYRGSVDFEGRVQARMEASILRNTFFIGPLVSSLLLPVTKILEYKITGTLHQPKIELLYVPKFLLLPLRPFQSLKEVMGREKISPASTPPAKSKLP